MPTPDPALRATLLDYFVEHQTSADLADWLRDIGQDAAGTVEQRRQRVRDNTKYLAMPPEGFPQQTRNYLRLFNSADHFADMCLALGLSDEGTKDVLYRRIFREIGYREGWIARHDPAAGPPTARAVASLLEWYPLLKRCAYERDLYAPLFDELAEVYGAAHVHEQRPIAHGTTLKIDFHVGLPQASGVGIEVKMPANNGDAQRALGQIDQYVTAYSDQLMLLILPDLLSSVSLAAFLDQLKAKGVFTVVKTAER